MATKAIVSSDKLKAIANAIRSKTGKTEMLSLDDMPTEITAIETGGNENLETELTEQEVLIAELKTVLEGKSVGSGGSSIAESMINKTITEYSNNDLKIIGDYAFTNAKYFESIHTPNVEEIGIYAFSGCSVLTTMDFKKCKTVGERGFYQCSIVQSLDMPLLESVGQHGFSRMLKLKTINTPSLKTIGTYGFYVSSALLKADFPQLAIIEANAFVSSKIEALIIRTPSVCALRNTNAFTSTAIASGTGYIYVPKLLIETYKSATNWSTYASQFRAIEDYPEITGG